MNSLEKYLDYAPIGSSADTDPESGDSSSMALPTTVTTFDTITQEALNNIIH